MEVSSNTSKLLINYRYFFGDGRCTSVRYWVVSFMDCDLYHISPFQDRNL